MTTSIKLSSEHKAHLHPSLVEEIAAGESVYEYKSVRMVHGAVKLTDEFGDAHYFYRGYEITLNESVSSGYYGRWHVGSSRNGHGDDSLEGCKKYIDSVIAAKAAKAV